MNYMLLVTNVLRENHKLPATSSMASKTCIVILALLCLFPLGNSVDFFDFPAVFNFGDSNSDTGNLIAAGIEGLHPPNGQSYFQQPTGRYCDGRLVIDFLSKSPINARTTVLMLLGFPLFQFVWLRVIVCSISSFCSCFAVAVAAICFLSFL